MTGDFKIRKVRTASGAMAVQIIRYANSKRIVVQHIGSAHTEDGLIVLCSKAEQVREELCIQPSLFPLESTAQLVHKEHLQLNAVTHQFAYKALKECCGQCGLNQLDPLYQDLALMRIIEPASKLRTLELLERYFNVFYAKRTVYRRLPKLVDYKDLIEATAVKTARQFSNTFALLLYDVTTLYFETHKPDDDLQARGFSKDDKSKQPQIVIGLLVTTQGFPLMHEVFRGNTFEGHTMLKVVESFQERYGTDKPIIVADAAMLSQENREGLDKAGYQYIVGARLANTKPAFIQELCGKLPRQDGAMIRLLYPNAGYHVICQYSKARYKKDKHEFDKQVQKAQLLIAREEPGRRAKFVKKSHDSNAPYTFDEALKQKTEQLLGIKGYCTNIPEEVCSNEQIIVHYHGLWHVEQAFRMSKSDLKTRPIFHYTHDAIRAHVLICFMALMMGKFLEIKTGLSLRRIRDVLWNVQEAHIEDSLTGEKITLKTNLHEYYESGLHEILKPH